MNLNRSLFASLIAFILATSCCWLPAMLITLGAGTTLIGIGSGLEQFSGIFMAIGAGLLGVGVYQYQSGKINPEEREVILLSTITCPICAHKKEETMPTNACTYFYECENCKNILKPETGDCCVFCSYGTVVCPPIQLDQDCC